MESVLAALKDTPIPTILVLAGIVFLLLSIAGQLAGRIAVAPERQRWAAVVGGVLLAAGIVLHVLPQARLTSPQTQGIPGPQPPTPPPEEPPRAPSIAPTPAQPPPSGPAPAPQPSVTAEIPSLNARLKALKFFESSPFEAPSRNERVYSQRFAKAITRFIWTELTLAHPKPGRRIALTIQAVYQHEHGRFVDRPALRTYVAADWEGSQFWTGSIGPWEVGPYKAEGGQRFL